MQSELISQEELIAKAKALGFVFGHGEPGNRIRYWSTIGLLPHAVRKKSANRNLPAMGHYPAYTVGLLLKIQDLQNKNIGISEIKEIIAREEIKLRAKEILDGGVELDQITTLPQPMAKDELIGASEPKVVRREHNYQKPVILAGILASLIVFGGVVGVIGFGVGNKISQGIGQTGQVLAGFSANKFLQFNSRVRFGETFLNLSGPSVSIDQDLTATSSPSFADLTINNTVGQITFPQAAGIVVLNDNAQTLTNKTLSGSNNTFSNIPNAALSNSQITINTSGSLSGGGNVALGGSITLTGSGGGSGTTSTASAGFLTLQTSGGDLGNSVLSQNGSTLVVDGVSAVSVGSYACVITTNGIVTDSGACPSGGGSKWQLNAGVLAPIDVSQSVAIGGTATASAKFMIDGVTGDVYKSGSMFLSNRGNQNVYLGLLAGGSGSSDGASNVAVGYEALTSLTNNVANNTVIGNQALRSLNTGFYNVAIGDGAMTNSVSGSYNTALGDDALLNTGSNFNVGIGASAGSSNMGGGLNMFLGYSAGISNTTGSNNIFIGNLSGIGYGTGSGNVFLGSDSYDSLTDGSDKLVIDTGSSNLPLIYGDFATGQVGINTNGLLSTFDVRAKSGTIATASVSGSTAHAALVVDNSGQGDIFTASSSGLTRFIIRQNGLVEAGTNPTTGYVTLGTDGLSTSPILNLQKTYTPDDGSASPGLALNSTFNYTSPGSYNNYGIRSSMTLTGSENTGRNTGIYTNLLNGSGTKASLWGVDVSVANNSGVVTDARGINVSISSDASITTAYGVYVNGMGDFGGQISYGFYQDGPTDLNYFAGNVGVGTTQPVGKIDTRAFQGAGITAAIVIAPVTGDANDIGTLSYFGAGATAGGVYAITNSFGGSGPPYNLIYARNTTDLALLSAWSLVDIGGIVSASPPVYTLGNVGIGTSDPANFVLETGGSIGPTTDDTYDLGSNGLRWKDLYLGPGSLHVGTTTGDEGLLSYDTSTNVLNISSTGSMALQPSSGNVGIGTSVPTAKLNVNGDVNLSGNTRSIVFTGSGDSSVYFDNNQDIRIYDYAGDGSLNLETLGSTGGDILLNPFTTQVGINKFDASYALDVTGEIRSTQGAYFATSTGNVGIGTTSPSVFKLQVVGSVGPETDDTYDLGSNSLRWRDLYLGPATLHIGTSTADEYAIGFDTSTNRLDFNLNGSGNAEMVIDGSGNVGIGTITPAFKLDVNGASNFGAITVTSCTGCGGGGASQWQLNSGVLSPYDTTQSLAIGGSATASAKVFINGVTGNVGIGSSTPGSKLVVVGPDDSTGIALDIKNNSNSSKFTLDDYGALYNNNYVNWSGAAGVVISSNAGFLGINGNLAVGSSYYNQAPPSGGAIIQGQVGIGTSSPDQNLTINNGFTQSSVMSFKIGGTTKNYLGSEGSANSIITGSAVGDFVAKTVSGQKMLFSTDGGTTPHLTINSSGNIGIGTSNPGKLLDIVSSTVNDDLRFSAPTTPTYTIKRTNNTLASGALRFSGSDDVVDWVVGTNYFTNANFEIGATSALLSMDSAGNVGIGTTTTTAIDLHLYRSGFAESRVTGAGSAAYGMLSVVNNQTKGLAIQALGSGRGGTSYFGLTDANGVAITTFAGSEAYLAIGTYTGSTPLIFGTNNLERVRIDSGGNVGVGTTNPAFKLSVVDSQAATASAVVSNANTGSDADGLIVKLGFTGTGSTTNSFVTFLDGNGAINGLIRSTGANGVAYVQNGIADFGEYLKSEVGNIPVGTVVCHGTNGVRPCSSSNKIAGVVSDTTAFLGGEATPDSVIVGFLGQIYVKTSESGIKAGDAITALGTKATKRGQIVGRAVMDQSGDKVLVLVRPEYFEGDDLNLATKLSVDELQKKISDLATSGSANNLELATVSGELKVLGKTQLAETSIGGKLTVGLLVFDDLDADLSSLGEKLSIQGGSVLIGKNGDLTTSGKIEAKSVTVEKINVLGEQNASGSAQPKASIGQATIPSGALYIIVQTQSVTPESRIFVTPVEQAIPVAAQKTGENEFTIKLKEPLNNPITINWWVIN